MVHTAPFLCAALALLTGSAYAAPSNMDWKYTRGWDGTLRSLTSVDSSDCPPADALATRAENTVGGIYLCADANWTGTCGYAVQPLNTCIVLGADWNKKISSLGPDPGTLVVAFENSDCTGNSTVFVNPGSGDLVSLGWNDRISSFEAFAQ